MRYLLSIALLILAQNSFAAEVYTCNINGKTVYQGKPCKGTGKTAADRVRENKEAELYSTNSKYTSGSTEKRGNKYSKQEWNSICRSASKTARAIMRNRQIGMSMNDQMDKLLPSAEPVIKDTIESMIRLAYTKPRFNTPEYRQRAEIDFENEYQLLCLQAE